jgi:pilus assembly protein TadC
VLLHSLMRAQFGLTLGFIALAVGVLISLPLVVSLVPSLADKHIFGLPLTLAVLGVAVYPVLVVIAIAYVRLAERTERHFLDLVEKL